MLANPKKKRKKLAYAHFIIKDLILIINRLYFLDILFQSIWPTVPTGPTNSTHVN